LLAPLWSGVWVVLSIAVPYGAPFFLPVTAARLARFAFAAESAFGGFALAAAVVPIAVLLSLVLMPGAAMAAGIASLAFVALPCLALWVGGRDRRRRDRVMLLVAAVTAVGALAILLGYALAQGTSPGQALASRWAAMIPDQLAAHRQSGWSESSILAATRVYEAIRALIAGSLEGIVLAASVLYAAILVYPASTALGLTFGMSEVSFGRFGTPPLAAVLFVPAGLAAALGSGEAVRLSLDLLLPLAALFFLRGLAIIRVLLDRARAGLFGRAVVYVLLFQMPFPFLLALGGLFDEFLNIRGRIEKAAEGRDE
jgi:hypothetical protein